MSFLSSLPFSAFCIATWTICKKDVQVWLQHPMQLIGSLLVPLSYFLVVYLGAQAVGRNPVVVVNEDQGTVGAALVHALVEADVFRVQVVSTPRQASALYHQVQVAAIITLPPQFSQEVAHHERAAVQVQINNLNLDLTNDIRRAVPDAITRYYQSLGTQSPITVTVAETRLHPQDIPLFQYSVLPLIILVVTVSGVITAGMAATTEWEQQTIKAVLLAPCSAFSLIAGKVLAGWLSTFSLATLLLLLGAWMHLTEPVGLYWFTTLLIIALGSLVSAGIGVAIGASFQRKQPVSYAATIAAVWLFALSGGVGVIFFEPAWLQAVAAFDPLTYAIHALQMAVFYQSFAQFGRDVLVLVATSALALTVGVLALRREMSGR